MAGEMGRALSPLDVRELMMAEPRTRLLDVRTPGEFDSVHVHGAYNVPLDTLAEHAAEIRAHVEEPIVLVCQSGARARKAEETLKASGFPNLRVLDGGVNAWVRAGLPVNRGRKRVSLERQVRMAAGFLVAVASVLALTIHPGFAFVSAFVGSGLVFAGLTDTCLMGMALARLPYNRASCDVDLMVRNLKAGLPPASVRS